MHTAYIVGLILAGFVSSSLGNVVSSVEQKQMISGDYSKIPSDRKGCDGGCGGGGNKNCASTTANCTSGTSYTNPSASCDNTVLEKCVGSVDPSLSSFTQVFSFPNVSDVSSVQVGVYSAVDGGFDGLLDSLLDSVTGVLDPVTGLLNGLTGGLVNGVNAILDSIYIQLCVSMLYGTLLIGITGTNLPYGLILVLIVQVLKSNNNNN